MRTVYPTDVGFLSLIHIFIGGASLAGGKGNVVKAVIGALIIALISNIMNLKGVPAYPQEIVKGCIIIAAVLLQIATDRSESAV